MKKFQEIPEVAGVEAGLLKFVVVEVTKDGEKRLLIRAAEFKRIPEEDRSLSHDDIFYSLSEELRGSDLKMLGGGWLDVYPRRVIVKGESHDHGAEPDRSSTVAALRRAFPEREIKVVSREEADD